jgi:hypothetical protein
MAKSTRKKGSQERAVEELTSLRGKGRRIAIRALAGVGALVFAWAVPYYAPGITGSLGELIGRRPPLEWSVQQLGSDSRVTEQPIGAIGSPQVVCDTNSDDPRIRDGFIEGDSNHAIVTIKVRRDVVVHFTGVNVKVLNRRPPLKGNELLCAGGYSPVVTVIIDLDTAPPTVNYYRQDDEKPRRRLLEKLRKGDELTLDVYARTQRNLVTWQGEIALSVDGKKSAIPLTNNGRPYSVTPGSNARLKPDLIKGRYEWNTKNWRRIP